MTVQTSPSNFGEGQSENTQYELHRSRRQYAVLAFRQRRQSGDAKLFTRPHLPKLLVGVITVPGSIRQT